jgi:Flp pilus assembly pilin Flp
MKKFIGLKDKTRQQRGATMVEYAIMLMLIAMVCFLMVTNIGQTTNSIYSSANSAFQAG